MLKPLHTLLHHRIGFLSLSLVVLGGLTVIPSLPVSASPNSSQKTQKLETKRPVTTPQPSSNYGNTVEQLQKSKQRWIEVRLRSQRLIAWEGDRPVKAVIVSTGKFNTTDTPTGKFSIQSKHRVARMQGDDYDINDVPYTMYYSGSYAIHGAYWHNKFGVPVSHGCVNVASDHARWLFDWAKVGTPVLVRQ